MRKLLFLFISIFCYAQAALSNENVFSLSSYVFETGTTETVYVEMDQPEAYGGFQFNLYLPEGVDIVMDGNNRPKIYEDGPWGGSDVTLACTKQKDGSYIFILYPNIGADMPKVGKGSIIDMMVETSADAKTGPAKVQFKNTRFASLDDVTIKLDNVEYDAEVISTCSVTASVNDAAKGSVEIVGGGSKVEIGSTVTVTATPEAGYEFVNWTCGDNVISSENPYQFTASQDIALVANFTARMYDVRFILDNGEDDRTSTLKYGSVIPTPENPERTGYTFDGWSPAFEEGTTVPVDGATYTAVWTINQYTITFDTDGGTEIAPFIQDYDSEITPPEDPTREGYTFNGWDTDIPSNMPAEDITIKAVWTVNQYTITFDTDGGTEIAPFIQDYDSKITPPENPTKEGYTFEGWDKEIPSNMPAENMTIKAVWTINQYVLTFMVDESDYKTIYLDYGSQIIKETEPDKEGFTFSGWIGLPETMPAHDVTVTGFFTVNEYTLSLYLNDELYSSEDIEYGTILKIDNPSVPEGCVFDGWLDPIPETMPAHNVEIYGTYSNNSSQATEIQIDNNSEVTIYSVFGSLICKNQRWCKIADTLANGIYIVNGQKIVIKR